MKEGIWEVVEKMQHPDCGYVTSNGALSNLSVKLEIAEVEAQSGFGRWDWDQVKGPAEVVEDLLTGGVLLGCCGGYCRQAEVDRLTS